MAKSRIKYLLWLLINIILYIIYGKNILYLLFSSLITYYLGKIIYKKPNSILLIIAILINLLPLIFFKYLMEIMQINFLIPLGISYYTLSLVSYLSDMNHQKYKPSDNLLDFLLFSFYFPVLFIGPIIRYDEFNHEIKKITFVKENVYSSFIRILIGSIKKFIIANKLSVIVMTLGSSLNFSGLYVLFGLIIYSIFLYCDFSGGIDIVLGISKIFNISLKENFDHPFHSESIKEFWHRWHISLGSWLKDYVYIPLGGSRVSKLMTKINVIITFLISGIWHGKNYLLWGLLNGILVNINLKTKKKNLNIIITFILISCLWIFFIYNDTLTAIKMFSTIFTNFNISINFVSLGLNIWEYLTIIVSLIIVILYENKRKLLKKYFENISIERKIIIILFLVLLVLLFGNYGLDVNGNNFVYGNF